MLSRRAEIARDWEDFLIKYLNLCEDNPYDEKRNPSGFVNFGTAVNNICPDLVNPKITSNEIWSCDVKLLNYREGYGIMRLREAFAKVMTEFLETHQPVSPENLICLTGVTSCLDLLAHCLGDPGDVFLVPAPMYGRILTDFKQRSLVDIWPIHIITETNVEDFPVLTIEKVISAHEQAVATNHVVRGILLINPSNPLGDIYSPKLLIDILTFCNEHSLHIIMDEVYASSVYSKTRKFHSILKFSTVDHDRTHVLYGLSKDFGLAGLRVGVIHTKCEPLKKSLLQLSFLQNIPFPLMEITARYLSDIEWLRKYLKIYQKRLGEKFDYFMNFLKAIGINIRDSSAGFFVWVDLRHLCKSFDQEMEFFNYLIKKERLYINPGKEFFCAQPGWFRIVFGGNPDHINEGLERFARAIKDYKPLNI